MLKKIILPLFLLSGCYPAIADTIGVGPNHQQAIQAYEDRKLNQAMNLWLSDAYQGYTEAEYRVAIALLRGEGVSKNHYEALYWLRRSSEAGYVKSQLLLGKLLVESGEQKNVQEGIDWWLRLAKVGNAEAQFNYAMALDQGIGVIQDRAAARQWLKKSIQAGSVEAKHYFDLMKKKSTREIANKEKPKIVDKSSNTNMLGNTQSSKKTSQITSDNLPQTIAAQKRIQRKKDKAEKTIAKGSIARVKVPTTTLRNDPSNDSRVLFRLTQGVLVKVLSKYKTWVKVSTPGGLPSWVKKSSLIQDANGKYVTKRTIWLYSSAGKSTRDRYGRLPKGYKLNILGQSEKWFKMSAPEWAGAWIPVADLAKLGQTSALSAEWQEQEKRLLKKQF